MHSDALAQLAQIMRKSELKKRYLPPVKLITPLQSAWVRCMLDAWGAKYGGYEGPAGAINILGRLMIRKEWNDRESSAILDVINNLSEQGYSGNELFVKAWQMINPQNSVGNLLERANEQEDADLVETVMCRIFAPSNPIRQVAIKYYCERKCAQDIAEYISKVSGMHIENSKTRVRWCRQLLEAAVLDGIKSEIESKKLDIAA